MTSSHAQLIAPDFDRIADLAPPGDVIGPHERWVLRSVPPRCRRVLDLGCGWSALSRALASSPHMVHGVDISARMVEEARQRSAGRTNVSFERHDYLEWSPAERYDCVVSVAALQHGPLARGLTRAAEFLEPGGVLLVVDLLDGWALSELPWSALARLLRSVRGGKRPGDALLRAAWREHAAYAAKSTPPGCCSSAWR